MKWLSGIVLCITAILSFTGCEENEPTGKESISWDELPKLPIAEGLSGAFAGVSNDALIVAGGVNYSHLSELESENKVWHDTIYILTDENQTSWLTGFKLDLPLAYGASVSTGESLIILGGRNAQGSRDKVTQLTWNSESQTIIQESLPSLPQSLSMTDASIIGATLYVAGGQTAEEFVGLEKIFWSLELDKLESGWKIQEPWQGPARRNAIVIDQNIGDNEYLFVMGGESLVQDDEGLFYSETLNDCYRYTLREQEWERITYSPYPIAAAPAIKYGQSHILVFGKSELKPLVKGLAIKGTPDPVSSAPLLAYHTITNKWVEEGTIPLVVINAEAVKWNDGIVLTGGETGPGESTPKIQLMIHNAGENASFGFINYTFLILYMIALVYMGIYFSKREKGTDDYFLAGRRIPWWAAGLSVLGTILSALTYIATPSMVYSMDWFMYPTVVGLLLCPIIIIYFYLPFFRRLNITTAFEYLELRFNLPVRLYGSAQFILFQLARISIILYLPAIVLSTITGINIYVCILSMGLLSTFYTVLGGIEAVVWTDVIQVFIFYLGIGLALFIIVFHIDGGVIGLIDLGMADDKFRSIYWDWDMTYPTLWVVIIGGGCGTLIQYSADQSQIQRYLTTKDERSAANGLWLNVAITIPSGLLFFTMGTALYGYYKNHPDLISLGMQNDAIFPLFVAQKLPVGIAGFLIAAIFSAAMSSLDSGMNSMATSFVTDFYRRFKPDQSERTYLNIARGFTFLAGLSATAFALFIVTVDIQSAQLLFSSTVGLLSSGLAGLFILGIFTRRAKGVGVFIGAIASALVLYYVKTFTPIHFILYAFIGIVVCVIVGYFASLIIPEKEKSLEGLTYYTALPKKD